VSEINEIKVWQMSDKLQGFVCSLVFVYFPVVFGTMFFGYLLRTC
jgi:hypothetical protein